MAEHKHAAVLRAIADGKAVQFKQPNGQFDWWDIEFSQMKSGYDPFTYPHYEWRIKPEPEPDVVRYVNLYDTEACVNRFHALGADDLLGTIKATIDGETGKLKSAEVLP